MRLQWVHGISTTSEQHEDGTSQRCDVDNGFTHSLPYLEYSKQDPNETPSYSASHSNQICMTMPRTIVKPKIKQTGKFGVPKTKKKLLHIRYNSLAVK